MPAAYEINSLLNSLLNVEVSDGTAAHSEQIDSLLPPGITQQHESLIQRAGEMMQDMSFFFFFPCFVHWLTARTVWREISSPPGALCGSSSAKVLNASGRTTRADGKALCYFSGKSGMTVFIEETEYELIENRSFRAFFCRSVDIRRISQIQDSRLRDLLQTPINRVWIS